MSKRIHAHQSASNIQALILDVYGKKVYQEKSLKNVTRRFNLSLMKLKDILHACGKDADLQSCEAHLRNSSGNIHHELTPARLLCFLKIARIGRCAIGKKNIEPSTFVHHDVLLLAKQLRTHLLSEEVSV
jgi:hypothetical protein